MDQLLCLESTWHDGYPLSQTLFTSLHIDSLLAPDGPIDWTKGDDLVTSVLRPYCEGVIKCCQFALNKIQSQTFFEEEDFVTHLFGRDLLPGLDVNSIGVNVFEAVEWTQDDELFSDEVQGALTARLRFRQRFLESLMGETETFEERNIWEDMKEELDIIKETHSLSRSTPEAFSEKIQRQLATSTPPRPMLHVSIMCLVVPWISINLDATLGMAGHHSSANR